MPAVIALLGSGLIGDIARAVLRQDLAFTRKGQGEHNFPCWRAQDRLPTPCLRMLRMRSLCEQLRIRFYIHQDFTGYDFGVA
jgi:hypothetical protein